MALCINSSPEVKNKNKNLYEALLKDLDLGTVRKYPGGLYNLSPSEGPAITLRLALPTTTS